MLLGSYPGTSLRIATGNLVPAAKVACLLSFHSFLILANLTTWEHISWRHITYLILDRQVQVRPLYVDSRFTTKPHVFESMSTCHPRIAGLLYVWSRSVPTWLFFVEVLHSSSQKKHKTAASPRWWPLNACAAWSVWIRLVCNKWQKRPGSHCVLSEDRPLHVSCLKTSQTSTALVRFPKWHVFQHLWQIILEVSPLQSRFSLVECGSLLLWGHLVPEPSPSLSKPTLREWWSTVGDVARPLVGSSPSQFSCTVQLYTLYIYHESWWHRLN